MNTLTSLARDWLPPTVVRCVRYFRGGRGILFEGDYATWGEASTQCTGYDAEGILAKVLDATRKVKCGEAAFERDSVLFDHIEYAWPVLSGLMWVAARNGGRLNVLDFGGSLGSSYFQNRNFLQTLPEVRWNVVEQVNYVEAGRAYIQNEQLKFFRTIEECLQTNQPNVILLSGVLQYLPDPYSLLKELLAIQASAVILDRTCYLNQGKRELIKIQHVPATVYAASYPCRFFLEEKLSNFISGSGYRKLEAFESIDQLDAIASWKGHIFYRQPHDS